MAVDEQAHCIDVFDVIALKGSHPAVRRLKKQHTGFDLHGSKVWNASYVLMDFLRLFPPAQGAAMLDLGCGWGVVSCYLAKHFAAQVTGVDADANVAPFYRLHAQVNGVELNFVHSRFQALPARRLAPIDEIVGADICFWDELVDPLKRLIRKAIRQDVARICIADPGRDPFWRLADYCRQQWPAEVYSHRIQMPRKTLQYVLEIAC